jgi:hypothetical protein
MSLKNHKIFGCILSFLIFLYCLKTDTNNGEIHPKAVTELLINK